jgi:ATP-dependent Clp endopeptidase proteolytic subunit ClpP
MRTSNWFEFKASADMPESDLFLYGEVGGWGASAAEFIDALSTRKEQRINLHIHSPGGSVFEGHAIFTALKSHPGGVTTWVDGIAASMASVIAMAGAPVKMASNAFLMIHNPWSQTAGGSDEMRKQADVLDKLKESLVKIYADKSGMTHEEISAAMDSETWFSAEEAVAFGLADEVFEGMKAAAKIDLSRLSAKAPAGVFEFSNPWPAPGWMRDNFSRGLDWFEKGFAGEGLADSTIKEARAIAGGGLVSPDKAQRMAAWFARHMGDLDGVPDDQDPPTPGMVAHALWGGWPKIDSERAMRWAAQKYAEHKKQVEQEGNTMENPEPHNAIEEAPVLPDFQAMLAKTEQDLLNAEARISGLSDELNAAQVNFGASKAECEGLRAELEAERAKSAAVAEQVNAKAASLIASSGHAPVAIGSGSDDKNLPAKGRTILERFSELRRSGNSAEWLAFLRKHRGELIEAARTN